MTVVAIRAKIHRKRTAVLGCGAVYGTGCAGPPIFARDVLQGKSLPILTLPRSPSKLHSALWRRDEIRKSPNSASQIVANLRPPAILHVISLAQFATAYTRSWSANSIHSRIRLQAQRDHAYRNSPCCVRKSGSRMPAWHRSIRIDVHIIHQPNDWQSWNSRRPAVGRWSRQPVCSTSRRPPLLRGLAGWMRKVQMHWSRRERP